MPQLYRCFLTALQRQRPTTVQRVFTTTVAPSSFSSSFSSSARAAAGDARPTPLQTSEVGQEDYRLSLPHGRSFWHDVPLFRTNDGGAGSSSFVCNFVNEIPRGSTAKLEVDLEHGSIVQDRNKDGSLRFFKAGCIPFNYGMLPQTFEDPAHVHPDTGYPGDGDPVDIVEISQEPLAVGQVEPVKILGVLALIDQGETDWKVLAIAESNPKAQLVADADDVERVFPGVIDSVREWFRSYKVADGKEPNEFALNEQVQSPIYASKLIGETFICYNTLYSKQQ